MSTESIYASIDDLKQSLRAGAELQKTLTAVSRAYDVPEPMICHWFQKVQGETPEEYSRRQFVDVSIDAAIDAAAFRWVKNGFGPNLVGRRFSLDFDRRNGRPVNETRWYRYIGYTGHWVEAIDEETLRTVKFDGGPEIWAEIRKKVSTAPAYERADQLQFSGSDADVSARQSILNTIRVLLIGIDDGEPISQRAEAVDAKLRSASSLTEIYESLTGEERHQLDYEVRHPPVQVIANVDGKSKSVFLERDLEVLQRLQRGEKVETPIRKGFFDNRVR